MKRCVALLLVLIQIIAMIPAAVFAEETVTVETVAETRDEAIVSEETAAETVPVETTEAEERIREVAEQAAMADTVVAEGACGDDLTWSLNAGVLTIQGTGDMDDYYNYDRAPWFEYRESITDVEMSDGLTRIGENAFRSCTGLTEVVIPDSVTTVGEHIFYGCSNLRDVTLSANMNRISDYAFCDCWALEAIHIPASVTSIDNYAFYNCGKLREAAIPEGVTYIGASAFLGTKISSVAFSSALTYINGSAFKSCNSLTEVFIPASIEKIGRAAFAECANLRSISVDENNPNYASVDGVLFDKNADTLIQYPSGLSGGYQIPEGVASIGYGAFSHCEKITYITVPDGVTAIGDYAFEFCTNVTGIDLPDSVAQIGALAFQYCVNLESMELPDGLTTMKMGLFLHCTGLKSVSIPDTVTVLDTSVFEGCSSLGSVALPETVESIGFDTFSGCRSLKEVNIPAQVSTLPEGIFENCSSLEQIIIPENVTTIEETAFSDCSSLKFVIFKGDAPYFSEGFWGDYDSFLNVTAIAYYPDSNPTWTEDVMLDYGGDLTWISYSGEGIPDGAPLALRVNNGEFSYISQLHQERAWYTFDYDENWFFRGSSKYNHDLARMSIRVAMAAADTYNDKIWDLFETLKFTEITSKYPAPTRDSIGYTIGSKTAQNEDGETMTLIAVAVRGGGYGAEWASNFTIGTTSEHQGFGEAADQVVSGVREHIEKIGASQNIKIWITGFSRAAATSNIAAHNLNALARRKQIPGLSEAGIFAYCFECPRGVRMDHPSYGADGNIFNIVNAIDVVPMVAPEGWDFGRYGITYYLPASELNYKGFSAGFASMKEEYVNILTHAGGNWLDAETLTGFRKGQSKTLSNLVDVLAWSLQSQSVYRVGYQDDIRNIMAALNNDCVDAGEVFAALLGVRALVAFPQILLLCPFVKGAADDIAHAHYPELCLAWMDALDGIEGFTQHSRTRYLTVNCPVDISVYDSSGTLVARILDDVVQEIPGSTIDALLDENGQKVVCLPLDETFEIQITANDAGTMSYQITETDIDTGDELRVVNYYDVPIRTGDQLTGVAGEAIDGTAVYQLLDQNREEIFASSDLSGDVGKYEVTVSAEGNGSVIGGGVFVPGEYAKVTATAGENALFQGWYCGEKLISRDMEYRFRVESDQSITGRFAEDLTGDGRMDENDAVYLIWHTLFPEMYPVEEKAADYNGDGNVTEADALILLWYALFPNHYSLT